MGFAKIMTKEKKKKKFFRPGCLIWVVVIFLFFMGLGAFIFEAYKSAEIKYTIKNSQDTYLKSIQNYKIFSDETARELSLKLYLLDRCEGGEKVIERYRMTDSNVMIYFCMDLLKLNINKTEILSYSESELENLKYLDTINFGDTFEEFVGDFLNK